MHSTTIFNQDSTRSRAMFPQFRGWRAAKMKKSRVYRQSKSLSCTRSGLWARESKLRGQAQGWNPKFQCSWRGRSISSSVSEVSDD